MTEKVKRADRISADKERLICALQAAPSTVNEIALTLGCSKSRAYRLLEAVRSSVRIVESIERTGKRGPHAIRYAVSVLEGIEAAS